MASKLVAEYAETADTLIRALRGGAAAAGEGTHAMLDSMIGPNEKVPDVAFLAELLARRLEHDRAELERAEQAKGAEGADTHDPRTRRDIAAHELYATLLEVKRTVGALFGATWVKKLQFPADFREDAIGQLLRAGKDVGKALKDRALPKPSIDGVRSIDPKPWQKRIKQAVKDLEAASEILGTEEQQLDDANVAKARAVQAFERTFAAASMLGIGAFTLAGRDADAEKVPRQPRKARRTKPAAPAPAPNGGGAPPDPSGSDQTAP
jgi:hypothetical protein